MTISQPAYPTQRAFVVQIHSAVDVTRDEVWGRVEHIVSGEATHFATVEDLVRFITKVLGDRDPPCTP
jgi:hypothetical protein